jgi:hypothetical protein
MYPIAFAVAVPAAFIAGVVFHKYVISEALTVDTALRSKVAAAMSEVKSWSEKESASAKDVLEQVEARLKQII